LLAILLVSAVLGYVVFGMEQPTPVYLELYEDFNIRVEPTTVSVTAGQEVRTWLYVTAAFNDYEVDLSVSGLPQGANCEFMLTGTHFTIKSGEGTKQINVRVSTSSTTPKGAYSVQIKAYAKWSQGFVTKYATFTLTVDTAVTPTPTSTATLPTKVHAADVKAVITVHFKSGKTQTISTATSAYLMQLMHYDLLPPGEDPATCDFRLTVNDYPMPALPEKRFALTAKWGGVYYVPLMWVLKVTTNFHIKVNKQVVWTSPSSGDRVYWLPAGQSGEFMTWVYGSLGAGKRFAPGSGWQVVADLSGWDSSKYTKDRTAGERVLFEYEAFCDFKIYLVWQIWRVAPFLPLSPVVYDYGDWVAGDVFGLPISWDPVDHQPSYVADKPCTLYKDITYTAPEPTGGVLPGSFEIFMFAEEMELGRNAEASAKERAINIQSFNDFSSPITMSVEGLPKGVTSTFSKNPVTPPKNSLAQTFLKLMAAPDAQLGTFKLTIQGTSGDIVKTATLTLTVKETGSPEDAERQRGIETTLLSATLSSNTASPLSYLTVSGKLVGKASGAPLSGKEITLTSSFEYSGKATTVGDGTFSVQVQVPSSQGAYGIFAQFLGDSEYAKSDPVALTFAVAGYPSIPDPFKWLYDFFVTTFAWLGTEGAKLATWIALIILAIVILWIIVKVATRRGGSGQVVVLRA